MKTDDSTPKTAFVPPPEWIQMSNDELNELRERLENVILKTPRESTSLLDKYHRILRQLENYIYSRSSDQSKDHIF